ncbi:S41 family peptidase [Chondrinema litorale]|uniref:S41 family peptidase n=1 Tax=Chondrinema litorale TaxID=2994555 RepID=UPI0025439EDD|nr:S41 family peptidase [Chondrinema litorale]UZR94081.1 S41 family peptidase [Chondrinema litorale]
MSENNIKNSNFQIKLPLLLSLAIVAGIFIGANVFQNGGPGINNTRGISKNAKKFRDIISYIERYYVDTVNTDELTEFAIQQMLEKLDPHTTYIPAEDFEYSNSHLQGNFEGVGIEFNVFKDTVYVVSTVAGGPSEQVGIRAGDKIVKVDTNMIAGINISRRRVIDLLRGKKGTKVNIGVKRRNEDELKYFTVKRDEIPEYSIEVSYMIDDKTGYIKINTFGAKTYDEFESSLSKLLNKGMKRLIVDLRGNGGGYMHIATKIADEFLKDGKLVVYTDGKVDQYDEKLYATSKGQFENGPLIVLIDENSASASEILSGAIQDNDRGLIVGRRSFGKGLVQRPIELEDKSELRLTISRYYTPSGRSIQKPYDDGVDYDVDITHRYEKGEFFSADSIHFDKSMKYETASGRAVYGGGGIMPDYFVPLDTTYYTKYLSEIFANNLIVEYAYDYVSDHKAELEKMGLENFKKEMYINQPILNDFKRFATAGGVKYNEEQFLKSKTQIERGIKSWIARRMWREEGFYPIYNSEDDIFQNAVELLDKAAELEN